MIAQALSAGIFKMVVTGNTIKKSHAAVTLSKTRPGFLYAAVGVHPHWSQKEWGDNSLKVGYICSCIPCTIWDFIPSNIRL